MRAGLALLLTIIAVENLSAQIAVPGAPASPISPVPIPTGAIQPVPIPTGGVQPVTIPGTGNQPGLPPGTQVPFTPTQPIQALQPPIGQPPVATLPVEEPKRSPVDPKVIAHLEGWEATMRNLTTFAVSATLTRKDLTTKRSSQFSGDIWCMKPNLARMSLRKQALPGEKVDPNDMMAYICNGRAIYEYDGAKKKLTAIPLGPNGFGNNLLLDLMTGMSAKSAMARFDFTLLKQDANYIYLEVKPVLTRDREEFQTMTLVLCNPANPVNKGLEYIPRMVILRQSNGQQEETWDFPKPVVNPKEVTEKHFVPEHPGKDWIVEEIKTPRSAVPAGNPAGGSPRVPIPGAQR